MHGHIRVPPGPILSAASPVSSSCIIVLSKWRHCNIYALRRRKGPLVATYTTTMLLKQNFLKIELTVSDSSSFPSTSRPSLVWLLYHNSTQTAAFIVTEDFQEARMNARSQSSSSALDTRLVPFLDHFLSLALEKQHLLAPLLLLSASFLPS